MYPTLITRRAYENDWRQVQRILGPVEIPLTVKQIRSYMNIQSKRGLTAHSLSRHLSAIRWYHHEADMLSPTHHPSVQRLLDEIRFSQRNRRRPRIRGFTTEEMISVIDAVPPSPKGAKQARDRALLLVGWYARLERNALVRLDWPDISVLNGGSVPPSWQVRIRHGRHGGRTPPIRRPRRYPALDPPTALERWQTIIGKPEGRVFRQLDRWGNLRRDRLSGAAVALVVKEAALSVGFSPDSFSGRSLTLGPIED